MTAAASRVPPQVGAAWSWWTGELRALWLNIAGNLPSRSANRARLEIDDELVVLVTNDGAHEERWESRTTFEALTDEDWGRISEAAGARGVHVGFVGDKVLETEFLGPSAVLKTYRAAIDTQIEIISPLRREFMRYAMGVPERREDRIRVPVTIISADRLDPVLDTFADRKIPIRTVTLPAGDREIALDGLTHTGRAGKQRNWRPALAAAAILATIPVTTWAGASLLTARAESEIEAMRDVAATGANRRRAEIRSAALEQRLVRLNARPAISELVAALAGRLEQGDILQRLQSADDQVVTATFETFDPERLRQSMAGLDNWTSNVVSEGAAQGEGMEVVIELRHGER